MAELLGCTVIRARRNGPKPRKPFATLRLYGFRKIGMDEERPTGTAGELEIWGEREATLEVQYFGDDAQNKLLTVEQSLQRPTIVDRCVDAGVAFFDAGSVQDLTALLDTTLYEERAAIDLSIRFAVTVADNPGFITRVNITMDNDKNFTVGEDDDG